MESGFQYPSQATYWVVPGGALFIIIHLIGLGLFCFIVAKRLQPMLNAERDLRFDRPLLRLRNLAQYWLGQWKHPRYPFAGVMHICIFAGFLILASRAFAFLLVAGWTDVTPPGAVGRLYGHLADYAATLVLLCMLVAAVRRLAFAPARYTPAPSDGNWRRFDAIFLLALIAVLMLSESLFDASKSVIEARAGLRADVLAPYSLPWILQQAFANASESTLQAAYLRSYLLDIVTFYFLLCYRPFGIQFHVETSLFNVFLAKLDRGTVKPIRWGISEDELDKQRYFGVKKFEDFTWKHILDFYSCADCGRCSDNCPANTVGRPLSPRFLSIKARDYVFQHYPVFGRSANSTPLIGGVYSEDEIWSCTTCGVCEEECPLTIEYIDKIVDLRRGLVDDGKVPKSVQKALKAIESRGNAYGKMEKKRADWAKLEEFRLEYQVKVVGIDHAQALYFVDSITSYDDRMQSIARATSRILRDAAEDFAILGPAERDSGHDVRRFGEETLFMALRDSNLAQITSSGAQRVITADPHAYNALKHDYTGVPPIEHISQTIERAVVAGALTFEVAKRDTVYAYHDPCYLGRHNQVYDSPRNVLDAIPGLKRVEMKRCRDCSFCCGGGGLMLFYEPKEEQRMGVKRVQMAADAGANVIVTACPFCMVNIEDAIKVSGMEGTMSVIDLTELVDQHIRRAPPKETSEEEVPAHALA